MTREIMECVFMVLTIAIMGLSGTLLFAVKLTQCLKLEMIIVAIIALIVAREAYSHGVGMMMTATTFLFVFFGILLVPLALKFKKEN